MKTLLAGLLAVGLASAASATTTVIHIAGSTAFRACLTRSVVDYLSTTGSGERSIYWGNSNFYKQNGSVVSGTIGGNTIYVEMYWTGAEAGPVDLCTANKLSAFISGAYYATSGLPTAGTGYYLSTTPVFDAPVAPDAAMADTPISDVAKAIKDANSTLPGYTSGKALANAVNIANLVDAGGQGTVGIIPFVWCVGNPGTAGESGSGGNMTQEAAAALIAQGSIPFSFITGSTSDITNFAFLVGRCEDSGTRLNYLWESQAAVYNGFDPSPIQSLVTFGTNATYPTIKQSTAYPLPTVNQGLNVGGNACYISSIKAWPGNTVLNTEPDISWTPAGHSGYITGGDVANVLLAVNTLGANISVDSSVVPSSFGFTQNTSKVSLIGFLARGDSTSLTGETQTNANGNGSLLTYNGVAESPTNIEYGNYSIWGYEHMYYFSGYAKASILEGIATQCENVDADIDPNGLHGQTDAAGVLPANMLVQRNDVGQCITAY